jgi:hypothetical protein
MFPATQVQVVNECLDFRSTWGDPQSDGEVHLGKPARFGSWLAFAIPFTIQVLVAVPYYHIESDSLTMMNNATSHNLNYQIIINIKLSLLISNSLGVTFKN